MASAWLPTGRSRTKGRGGRCVDRDINFEISDWTPLLGQGGVAAPSISCSEGTLLLARTGWLVQEPLIFWTSTTPSAPSTVASQHSIDGAATPPRLRRGVILSP